MTTLENIEQVERLLTELKTNIIELDTVDMHGLRALQERVQNNYYFPKYCLNVRRDVKKYFVNQYADTIYNILANPNRGIPISTIIEGKGEKR